MIDIIKSEFQRRMIEEGLARIVKCVSELSDEHLWYKHNQNTNTVGNIILHLSGNVKQYITSGIGKQKDNRDRPSEFLLSSKIDREGLINKISLVVEDANNVVKSLQESELKEERKIQGFEENVLSVIIHVIEHFSYHVGQITFFTKYINNIDTRYYGDLDLNITDQ